MFLSLGVSQAGESHLQRCIPCQDYNTHRVLPDGTAIGIIADGVGASPVSQTGSQTAAETAMNTIVSMLENSRSADYVAILQRAFEAAREAVISAANTAGTDPGLFETTLSAVIVTENHIACGHSGDGGVIVLNDRGVLFPITVQQSGQYDGQVYSLVSHPDHWTFSESDVRCAGVILATDGMYDYFNLIEESQRASYLIGYLTSCQASGISPQMRHKALSRHVSSQSILDRVDDDRTVLLICTDRPLPSAVSWKSEPASGPVPADRPEIVDESTIENDGGDSFVHEEKTPSRSKAPAIIVAALIVLAVIAGIIFFVFGGKDSSVSSADVSSSDVSSADASSSDVLSPSDTLIQN